LTQHTIVMMKHRVTSFINGSVHAGTQLAVSLHWRNVAKGETGMTETCAMSSVAKMHAAGSKTDIWIMSALNMSNVKRGTMTTLVPITNNLTDSILLREGAMQEESRHFPTT
jgi:hypothetical protein